MMLINVSTFAVADYYPENVRHCPCFIRHKSTLVSPSVLRQNAVPYDKVLRSHSFLTFATFSGKSGDSDKSGHSKTVAGMKQKVGGRVRKSRTFVRENLCFSISKVIFVYLRGIVVAVRAKKFSSLRLHKCQKCKRKSVAEFVLGKVTTLCRGNRQHVVEI